jgi:hypothetical protein
MTSVRQSIIRDNCQLITKAMIKPPTTLNKFAIKIKNSEPMPCSIVVMLLAKEMD